MTAPGAPTTPVPAGTIYHWRVQRGESAGLLLPVHDAEGDLVDVTDPSPWPVTARVHPEPGDDSVLLEFVGDAVTHGPDGVHLHLTAQQTLDATWRRGWLVVVMRDPQKLDEVSVIARGPLTLSA